MINSPSGSLRAVGKSIIPGKPKLPIVVFESLSAYALFDERKNERAKFYKNFGGFKNDVWFHQCIQYKILFGIMAKKQ